MIVPCLLKRGLFLWLTIQRLDLFCNGVEETVVAAFAIVLITLACAGLLFQHASTIAVCLYFQIKRLSNSFNGFYSYTTRSTTKRTSLLLLLLIEQTFDLMPVSGCAPMKESESLIVWAQMLLHLNAYLIIPIASIDCFCSNPKG